VDVVRGAARGQNMHPVIARDSGEVVPQTRLVVGGDEVGALFGAEDDVEDGTDVAVRHIVSPPKGGSNYFWGVGYPALPRWAKEFGPGVRHSQVASYC
jgi:hypothetical protein